MHVVGKLAAAVLLTMCIGLQLLEASGRWDRSFADANDEAGIVAVALCVGIAIAVAGTLLDRLRTARAPLRVPVRIAACIDHRPAARPPLSVCANDPPLPLRL